MKKGLMAGILGMALLAGWPLMAAEDHSKHMGGAAGEFCTKHCNAVQLGKEVKALEKEIAADKAALKSGGSGEKLATLMSKREQLKKHLDQHAKELEDLKTRLEKDEAGMNQ